MFACLWIRLRTTERAEPPGSINQRMSSAVMLGLGISGLVTWHGAQGFCPGGGGFSDGRGMRRGIEGDFKKELS